ncbi:MAG: alkane 1-monooxygenase [Alphaproteobacteria bacterium]|nr:alkane 1-monooxygenase [Alphaproteobacteria bacterium]
MNLVVLYTTVALIAYSPAAVIGLVAALALDAVVDEKLGDTRRNYSRAQVMFLDATLFLMLPLIVLLALAHATTLSAGDPFGLGAAVLWLTGYDALAVRDSIPYAWHVAASIPAGILYGVAAINVAHELFHRLRSPTAVITARWLLAFSCDTTFAIEHVYGHHRHVGTPQDPATARRGETFYRFLPRSIVGEIGNAFRHEANRLRNRGRPVWSWQNRAFRGQIMSLAVALAYMHAAGAWGLLGFLAAAFVGKSYLEATNYIEHYGLVRVPGQRVEARHSWDSYRKLTGALLYNLPRHADHHLHAEKAFWHLKAIPEAPVLPYGYQAMILIALLPGQYFRVMDPLLRIWDETMASPAERDLIAAS